MLFCHVGSFPEIAFSFPRSPLHLEASDKSEIINHIIKKEGIKQETQANERTSLIIDQLGNKG